MSLETDDDVQKRTLCQPAMAALVKIDWFLKGVSLGEM
jgi:hypothetical protein